MQEVADGSPRCAAHAQDAMLSPPVGGSKPGQTIVGLRTLQSRQLASLPHRSPPSRPQPALARRAQASGRPTSSRCRALATNVLQSPEACHSAVTSRRPAPRRARGATDSHSGPSAPGARSPMCGPECDVSGCSPRCGPEASVRQILAGNRRALGFRLHLVAAAALALGLPHPRPPPSPAALVQEVGGCADEEGP